MRRALEKVTVQQGSVRRAKERSVSGRGKGMDERQEVRERLRNKVAHG